MRFDGGQHGERDRTCRCIAILDADIDAEFAGLPYAGQFRQIEAVPR